MLRLTGGRLLGLSVWDFPVPTEALIDLDIIAILHSEWNPVLPELFLWWLAGEYPSF